MTDLTLLADQIRVLLAQRHDAYTSELADARGARDRQRIASIQTARARLSRTAITDAHGVSTFENLLKGKLKTAPHREAILWLADYLACSHRERNQLLACAGHAPDLLPHGPRPSPEFLRIILERLHRLPWPGFAVDQSWDALGVNDALARMTGIPPDFLERLPPRRQNVLFLLCHPHAPFRKHLSVTEEGWEELIRINIRAFKQGNLEMRAKPWYREKVRELHESSPDLRRLWDEVDVHTPIAYEHAEEAYGETPILPELITPFRTLGIPDESAPEVVQITANVLVLGEAMYPRIFFYEPYDEAARSWFAQLGIGGT